MLEIRDIHKEYRTGSLVQKALDGVSLNLRDNEFVAILGPSGSGKTTLLNIIGGLDRYDSGDLIINKVSTKKYKDRDWDSYRNHTIGFVFQSYNLIPHQTVLANVELALTISGISGAEKRKRATEALQKVGLGEQLHKKPSQMSGGQMQRVAIARALVNNPDILLADEPTGALDTETSIQVMELLKEVAKDRLVVMVTHNPELAEQYATRTVRIKDGKIIDDTNPYEVAPTDVVHKNLGHSSMSFLTALSLSLNNLLTKKARTLLVAFAGSIGIIGIALILSLSTGVNNYIKGIEEETLSEYPISITSDTYSIGSMMGNMATTAQESANAEVTEVKTITNMFTGSKKNDLEHLKIYLEENNDELMEYAKAVEYSYDINPLIYLVNDKEYRQVNPDTTMADLGLSTSSSSSLTALMMNGSNTFNSLPEDDNMYKNQYAIKAGRWPEKTDELVMVLGNNGMTSDVILYATGLKDYQEMRDYIEAFNNNKEVTTSKPETFKYNDFIGLTFKLVNLGDTYQYDEELKLWTDKSKEDDYMRPLFDECRTLTIVGVVEAKPDATANMLTAGIYYPFELIDEVVEDASNTPIVKEQLANKDINVFTQKRFDDTEDMSFDLSSLFNVDTDAMSNSFNFDSSNFKFDEADLSEGMDFNNMFDFSALAGTINFTQEDLECLFNGVINNVSFDETHNFMQKLWSDFLIEAAKDPTTDIGNLGNALEIYLKSNEFKQVLSTDLDPIIKQYIQNVLKNDVALTNFMNTIMNDFSKWIITKGYTDTTKMTEYFAEYLSTPEGQATLTSAIDTLIASLPAFNFTEADLEKLVTDTINGYNAYAVTNNLPQADKIIAAFEKYLTTQQAQDTMMSFVNRIINMDTLMFNINYIANDLMMDVGQVLSEIMGSSMENLMGKLAENLTNSIGDAFKSMDFDTDMFSDAMDLSIDEDKLSSMFGSMMNRDRSSYESNLRTLGYAKNEVPYIITIYPKDFESKDYIASMITRYNDDVLAKGLEDREIQYTDIVGTLMSSVTTIINAISYILIAFVAISLIVSSIMIGVITYI
ncbi:MAG: ABC transporter ATP-binding protein, partial [Erysipelotrichaceae bacterium]|nr:ABC transporter ATP-binding protein [Erysipelotrichaceae bacterium]